MLPEDACSGTGDYTSFTIHIELHDSCALSVIPSCRQIFEHGKTPHLGTHLGIIVNRTWFDKLEALLPGTTLEHKISSNRHAGKSTTVYDEVAVLLPNGLALQFLGLKTAPSSSISNERILVVVCLMVFTVSLIVFLAFKESNARRPSCG
jgi:hypothetical protein